MGQSSPEQKKKIEERREEVRRRLEELEKKETKKEKKQVLEEIAQALNVSVRTIEDDQTALVRQGKLKVLTKTEKRRIEVKRRLEELEKKETKKEKKQAIEEIAQALNVTVRTIQQDIKFWKEEREKEIVERCEKGESKQQIAQALEISIETVKNIIEYIEIKSLSREERLKKEEELIKAGKTVEEIAEKMKKCPATIKQHRKYLKGQNRITGKEKSITKTYKNFRKKLKKFEKMLEKEEGKEHKKTQKQMAEELGVSEASIEKYKKILKKEKEEKFAKWNEKVIKLYDDFYGQSTSIEKFEEYLTLCKERYEQRLLEEEHLLPIKYAAIATETYSNVAFYIKLCNRFSQWEEAIQFAKNYVNCEAFSQEEKEKIRRSITECKKICQAIDWINKGNSNEAIKNETGLSNGEIALLRKKAEKRANGDGEMRSKEEMPEVRNNKKNDDGDEPEIAK